MDFLATKLVTISSGNHLLYDRCGPYPLGLTLTYYYVQIIGCWNVPICYNRIYPASFFTYPPKVLMPEGPSIVILKEAAQPLEGKKIYLASGNSKKIDFNRLTHKKIIAFKSWGKHFLICFDSFTVRIHFLLFGSYRMNEEKSGATPKLMLQFAKGMSISFYSCAVSLIEQSLDDIYDWTSDVMNKEWSEKKAMVKLKDRQALLVCDALLDQNIFSGVGNIIKNEVLFRIRVHPSSVVSKMPWAKRKALVREAVHYSFQFLEWKKQFTLKKHWLAHTKKICPRDGNLLSKEYLGRTKRRTFFCEKCQRLYV